MSFFKKPYSGFRGVLFSSVAVIGLASVAQAQVAELKGLMDNKDFGESASFYLPLGMYIPACRSSVLGQGCWGQ